MIDKTKQFIDDIVAVGIGLYGVLALALILSKVEEMEESDIIPANHKKFSDLLGVVKENTIIPDDYKNNLGA